MQDKKLYDVAIIGGGIVGSAILYVLSNYTNLKKIALIEKEGSIASLNSNSTSNSQTLHFGDVETNYTEEKTKRICREAELILSYAKSKHLPASTILRCQKMLLAVGDSEIEYAEKWYESCSSKLFKGLKHVGKKEILRVEPNLIKGRSSTEEISAYMADTGYMVDFGRLSESFIKNSKPKNKKIDVRLNTRVNSIRENNDGYTLQTPGSSLDCRFAVFATGAYSLAFAKSLGLAGNLGIIPTGGGFFKSRKVLNGKVYRVQMGKVPFAAVHGDPDINDASITRFGPVIYLPASLEKGRLQPLDYLKLAGGARFVPSAIKILSKYKLHGLISRHMSYSIPLLGQRLFASKEVSKIVPSLKYSDLSPSKRYGGISPRIIDTRKHILELGEEKIKKGGTIFDISPSPGASSSLAIAMSDTKYISKYLGCEFFEEDYRKELMPNS